MQINVSQLLKAPIGSVRNYEINQVVEIDGCNYPLQGTARLMRTDHGILVKGTIKTESELTCSRCLNVFKCPLALNIEEEYFPTIDMVTGAPLAPPDDPASFTIDEHNILDLTEAVRQYALLTIPMKPLCHPDCAGLCPTCGANLNQAQCSCPPQPPDSRWAALRELVSNETEPPVKNSKGRK
ncbi:MAG: DUF177 domain-containing protein [Chloroflexi bacterium]|nr:DUF177 domain-containing protein [Chloroflexota bacterium]